jgi:hypothetical protein
MPPAVEKVSKTLTRISVFVSSRKRRISCSRYLPVLIALNQIDKHALRHRIPYIRIYCTVQKYNVSAVSTAYLQTTETYIGKDIEDGHAGRSDVVGMLS